MNRLMLNTIRKTVKSDIIELILQYREKIINSSDEENPERNHTVLELWELCKVIDKEFKYE